MKHDWISPDWPAPTNVRAFVTTRSGGVSVGPRASLNLGYKTGDDPKAVTQNRAIVETFANPAPSIAATRAREPILDEKVELERWHVTSQYVGAADTRGHGLGDIRKLLLDLQVDEVVDVYGLKTKPSTDTIFNLSMLPPKSERMVKA